jgi:prepilin-type N-terminal cleavage/methylation domain-containing protein
MAGARKTDKRVYKTRPAAGFTLIEVLVAIMIVAAVSIVLIYRRIDVVRDAAQVRNERVAWTLAALKLGDLSLDPSSILESDGGNFEEDAPDYSEFQWSYESQLEPVAIDDAPVPDEAPRMLRRVTLKIFDAEDVELQSIEAMFPVAAQAEENP